MDKWLRWCSRIPSSKYRAMSKRFTRLFEEMAQRATGKNATDVGILRQAIISELDAITLYEQFAEAASSPKLKEVLLSISEEEKVHVGEFEALLKEFDKEYEPALRNGEEEQNDL